MSERKVLNKYYPIDYDPRRLPRQKGMGNIEDKIMVIRTMAPFHMRCKTCGKYTITLSFLWLPFYYEKEHSK